MCSSRKSPNLLTEGIGNSCVGRGSQRPKKFKEMYEHNGPFLHSNSVCMKNRLNQKEVGVAISICFWYFLSTLTLNWHHCLVECSKGLLEFPSLPWRRYGYFLELDISTCTCIASLMQIILKGVGKNTLVLWFRCEPNIRYIFSLRYRDCVMYLPRINLSHTESLGF